MTRNDLSQVSNSNQFTQRNFPPSFHLPTGARTKGFSLIVGFSLRTTFKISKGPVHQCMTNNVTKRMTVSDKALKQLRSASVCLFLLFVQEASKVDCESLELPLSKKLFSKAYQSSNNFPKMFKQNDQTSKKIG